MHNGRKRLELVELLDRLASSREHPKHIEADLKDGIVSRGPADTSPLASSEAICPDDRDVGLFKWMRFV